jgi:hypothetical protein
MKPKVSDKAKELYTKLHQLAHAVQTGVMYEIEKTPANSATSPKHLRTGVNMAMCENAALVELLIDKGIFTLEEILQYNCNKVQEEVENYERRLSAAYGMKITLG